MIRPLLITFAVATGTAIIAGIAVSALHPVKIGGSDWNSSDKQDVGPVVTRDFAWAGSPNLTISIPAEVTYIQGATTKMTVTGPSSILDEIEITKDQIKFKCNFSFTFIAFKTEKDEKEIGNKCAFVNNHGSSIKITITSPATEQFNVNGAAKLDIQSYDRPSLKLDVSGAGKLTAAGKAQNLVVDLSGATDADFSKLAVTDAKLDISGVGHARLNATGNVSVDISGAGAVDLLTRPAKLTQDISGAGHVSQP